MGFVFSPSNIMTYMQCPRKFWGQSISKLIKYKASKQKSRGILVHEQMQDAMRDANKFGKLQEDPQLDSSYAAQRVAFTRAKVNEGYKLNIEYELCMGKDGKPRGWWADDAFLRAKADAVLIHDNPELPVYVIDIKTGKAWDETDVQLRVESLLLHILYQRPLIKYEYWYVDQGDTTEALLDFRNGLAPVADIYDIIKTMNASIKQNDFPCTKNSLCRWCDFKNTKECDAI